MSSGNISVRTSCVLLASLLASALANAAVIASLYCVQPLLPALSLEYGGRAAVALLPAAALAGYGVGVLGLVLLPGDMTRRPAIAAHLLLLVSMLYSAALMDGLIGLVVAHVGIGIGAACTVRIIARVARIVPGEWRALALGIAVAGGLSGLATARAGVSDLAEAFGGWRGVYSLSALAVAASGTVMLLAMPCNAPTISNGTNNIRTLWCRYPELPSIAGQQAASFAAFNAAWIAFLSGTSGGAKMAVVSGAGAAAALLTGWLCGRLGAANLVRLGVVALAISAIALCANAAPSWLCMLVLDIGVQTALVANQTRVQALDPSVGGRSSALITAAGFGGASVGAAAAHLLIQNHGAMAAFGLAAVAGTAALLLGGSFVHTKHLTGVPHCLVASAVRTPNRRLERYRVTAALDLYTVSSANSGSIHNSSAAVRFSPHTKSSATTDD